MDCCLNETDLQSNWQEDTCEYNSYLKKMLDEFFEKKNSWSSAMSSNVQSLMLNSGVRRSTSPAIQRPATGFLYL